MTVDWSVRNLKLYVYTSEIFLDFVQTKTVHTCLRASKTNTCPLTSFLDSFPRFWRGAARLGSPPWPRTAFYYYLVPTTQVYAAGGAVPTQRGDDAAWVGTGGHRYWWGGRRGWLGEHFRALGLQYSFHLERIILSRYFSVSLGPRW